LYQIHSTNKNYNVDSYLSVFSDLSSYKEYRSVLLQIKFPTFDISATFDQKAIPD